MPVTVLTVQGMTAVQWAWLQAIGGLLGIGGTVLGYPFIKSRFDKKTDRNSIIKAELKELVDNTTSLYNEMVTVFTPYLHPDRLTNKKRREQQAAAEQFALRRDYRDKIDKSCAVLRAAGMRLAEPIRSQISASTAAVRAFLEIVSGSVDPCFLGSLGQPDLPTDFPERVKAWLEQSRSAHDAVIRNIGQSLSSIEQQ